MGTRESKMGHRRTLGHVECGDRVGGMCRESVQAAGGSRSQVSVKEA